MTVLMKPPQQNRKYLRPHGGTLTANEPELFLVYQYDPKTKKIASEGPYTDEEEAHEWMRERLAQGTCAWIVSYNG